MNLDVTPGQMWRTDENGSRRWGRGTHFRWAYLVGNKCRFPRRGRVGGPGGNPGSRAPIRRMRLTSHVQASNATVMMMGKVTPVNGIADVEELQNEDDELETMRTEGGRGWGD